MKIIRRVFGLVAGPAFLCTDTFTGGYHAFIPFQTRAHCQSSPIFSTSARPSLHSEFVRRPHIVSKQIGNNYKLLASQLASITSENSITTTAISLLSEAYMESDLVAVKVPPQNDDTGAPISMPRLCVVRADGSVSPLCRHEDDVETDLFLDPRKCPWPQGTSELTDEDVVGTYGEGWYGQRPVPSLGGGPGYGAEADEIWSVDEDLPAQLEEEGVDLPLLDVGIAHGEKARGGAF